MYLADRSAIADGLVCSKLAELGYLEQLKEARRLDFPWNEWDVCECRHEWAFEVFEVRARARVSLGLEDVLLRHPEWTFGMFEVRARARLSLGREDVHECRPERTIGVFEVRAREWMSLERVDVRTCRHGWRVGMFEVRA